MAVDSSGHAPAIRGIHTVPNSNGRQWARIPAAIQLSAPDSSKHPERDLGSETNLQSWSREIYGFNFENQSRMFAR